MKIVLVDDSVLEFNEPITIREVAASITPWLGKNLIAGIVNDKFLFAGATVIKKDCKLQFITSNKHELEKRISAYTGSLVTTWALKNLYPTISVMWEFENKNGIFQIVIDSTALTEAELIELQAEARRIIVSGAQIECCNIDFRQDEVVYNYVTKNKSRYQEPDLIDFWNTSYLQISTWQFDDVHFLPTYAFYEDLSRIKVLKILKQEEYHFPNDSKTYHILTGFATTDEVYATDFLLSYMEK